MIAEVLQEIHARVQAAMGNRGPVLGGVAEPPKRLPFAVLTVARYTLGEVATVRVAIIIAAKDAFQLVDIAEAIFARLQDPWENTRTRGAHSFTLTGLDPIEASLTGAWGRVECTLEVV